MTARTLFTVKSPRCRRGTDAFPSRPLIDKGAAGGRSPDTVDPRIMADIVKGVVVHRFYRVRCLPGILYILID